MTAGNWELETGNLKLEIGNWQLATGNWQLETGDWKLAATPPPLPPAFASRPIASAWIEGDARPPASSASSCGDALV